MDLRRHHAETSTVTSCWDLMAPAAYSLCSREISDSTYWEDRQVHTIDYDLFSSLCSGRTPCCFRSCTFGKVCGPYIYYLICLAVWARCERRACERDPTTPYEGIEETENNLLGPTNTTLPLPRTSQWKSKWQFEHMYPNMDMEIRPYTLCYLTHVQIRKWKVGRMFNTPTGLVNHKKIGCQVPVPSFAQVRAKVGIA